MRITHDPAKNRMNISRHGIDLTDVEGVFYDDLAITLEKIVTTTKSVS